MAKVSASAAIGAAFNSVGSGWRAAWGALLLFAVANFTFQLWGASVTGWTANLNSPSAMAAHLGDLRSLPLLLILLIGAGLSAYGALYRANMDQADENGPAGLQWRAGEWRILGAMFVLGLAALPLILLWGAVFGMAAVGARSGSGAAAASAAMAMGFTSIVVLVAAPLLTWVSIRLSPFLAATIDQRRIVTFGVWRLTAGNFWSIFGALVVVGIAAFGVSLVGSMAAFAVRASEGAILHATPAQLIVPSLIQSAAVVVLLPAKVGLMAHVYRSLRPNASVAEVFS